METEEYKISGGNWEIPFFGLRLIGGLIGNAQKEIKHRSCHYICVLIKVSTTYNLLLMMVLTKQPSHKTYISWFCFIHPFMDFFICGRNCCQIFSAALPTWGLSLEPNLHLGGVFFGTWQFLILKSSHQDLSNEGSNFILSPLEVGL